MYSGGIIIYRAPVSFIVILLFNKNNWKCDDTLDSIPPIKFFIQKTNQIEINNKNIYLMILRRTALYNQSDAGGYLKCKTGV